VACAADEPIINALVAVGSERSNVLQLYQLLQSEALLSRYVNLFSW
jgi:hypothetical protein